MQRAAAPAEAGHEVRTAVRELADALRGDLDAVAEQLTDRIHDRVAVLEDDVRPATVDSTRANLAIITKLLHDGAPPQDAPVPLEATFYARELARRQIGLDVLLQIYRVAHGAFTRMCFARLEEKDLDRDALARSSAHLSDWMFDWIDGVLLEISQQWTRERERWVRTSTAVRAETVKSILDGADVEVTETSARLGYELDRSHIAFIVWTEGPASDATPRHLEAVAEAVVAGLGGRASLIVAQGSLRVDGWVAVVDGDGRGDAALPSRLGAAAGAGARVAIGGRGHGLEGFRRSHEDAAAVQRLAAFTHRTPGACLRFEDSVLDALLLSDRAMAERFVRVRLAGLEADNDGVRRIAATLRVFLEENGSYTRAARRIGVHQNTVTYRVRRAEDLLGRPLDRNAFEVLAALRIADLLRRGG